VEVDSLLRELEVVRHRLSPLEHRLVEYMLAARVEDWERCYRAIREAAAIAPDQFSYTQAIRALTLQRPREAVTALTREHLDSIYRDDVRNYWSVLTLAYHQLGEHRMELATARKARQPAPANASLLSHEIRALAAMGRIAAVRARTDSLLALPRDGWFTPGVALMQIGSELRAHGHMAAAAEILSRAVAWYRSRPPVEVETETHGYFLGWTLIVAGRFSEADSVFAGLHSDHPKNPEYVGYLGALAARRGDRARALRLAAQLEGREVEAPIPGELSIVNRARIAILLVTRPARCGS
jgi:tetratricopeptide (TPR) repeat protein